MKLRDVMVVLDNSARNEAVLDVAVGIALRHDARLTGFCPNELLVPKDISLALGAFPPLLSLSQATAEAVVQTTAIAAALGSPFSDVLRLNGLQGEWQTSDGPAPSEVSERARTADLLVLGQPDPNHPVAGLAWLVVEDALLHGGRPLLLVPFTGRFGRVGSRVIIAWNGTREAARAAHDATR
jgi:nucleotide-binding universal stress UspA family protein